MTSKPRKSTLTACRAARKAVIKATPTQRAKLFAHGMLLINCGSTLDRATCGTSPTQLDTVLGNQLKALGCAFSTTLSPYHGMLLHIGPPDTFWTQPERLMLTVRAFYPLATFALSDAEGCTSIALFGTAPRVVSKAVKGRRK